MTMGLSSHVVHRRRRIAGACALAGAVSLLPVACSSSTKPAATNATSSSSQSTSAPPTSAAGAAATGAPIKVGILCSCSGPFGAQATPEADVYKAWVNTVNASGGINRHPIQLTYEDDNTTPGTSVSDAQILISDHVDAIVDMSIVDQSWATEVQAARIPVVGSVATDTTFYTNSDFYSEGQTGDSIGYSVAATTKAAGADNYAVLYCAESASCSQQVPLIKTASQTFGIPDVYNAEIAFTAPNYTAQCVVAQEHHAQSVFIADGSTILSRVATDCAHQGYNPIYVQEGEGYTNSLTSGAISRNLWSEWDNLPYFADTPAVQAMNAAVDKYYPGIRNNANNWSELAAGAWPSGLLLEDAAKAGGLTASDTPSAAEIVTGLESLKGDTLDGWAPPLTFPAGKPHPIDCWFTGKVENGVPSVANNGQVTCQHGSTS
jgi:branched-chain amino acid transport system substrate-binding protein